MSDASEFQTVGAATLKPLALEILSLVLTKSSEDSRQQISYSLITFQRPLLIICYSACHNKGNYQYNTIQYDFNNKLTNRSLTII